ncbi:MAG: cation:proton antiporter, partial [Nitrospinota bacterium]
LIGINTLLLILLKVVLFFATILFIGLIAFPDRAPEQLPPKPGLLQIIAYRFSRIFAAVGIRNLLLVHRGEFTPLIMLFIAMLFGVISFKFGFHPAIGAYFAGLFLHKDYFIFKNPKNDEIDETAKGKDTNFKRASHVIEHLAFTIFGPIFFVNLGGKLVFDTAVLLKAVPAVLFLYCTVVILQVLSAMLAARFTGNYKWHESVMIGLGMLGRAELAFIVINIAYVQNKIIDLEQFYTLMFVTFLLNITVPISLKLWKPYYLGFKQLSVLGVKLSRAEPAPIPKHMQEHHKVMAEEKSKYI